MKIFASRLAFRGLKRERNMAGIRLSHREFWLLPGHRRVSFLRSKPVSSLLVSTSSVVEIRKKGNSNKA